MEKRSKKSRVLLALFAVFSTFFTAGVISQQNTYARDTWVPCTAGAQDCTSLYFEAVRCDADRYSGQTDAKVYQNCLKDYNAGNLSSYLVNNNSKINAGDRLLVVAYVSPKRKLSNENVASYGIKVAWDPTQFKLVNNMATSNKSWLPSVEIESWDGSSEKVTWGNVSTTINREGLVTFTADSNELMSALEDNDDDPRLGMINSKTMVATLFVQAADTIPGGGQGSFWFVTDPGETTLVGLPAGHKSPYSATDLVINFAGASKSTDASLSALKVSKTGGSANYTLDPAFTAGDQTNNKIYSTVVPQGTTSVDISATATDAKATRLCLYNGQITATDKCTEIGGTIISGSSTPISGVGTKSLGMGDNKFTLAVTSESGNVQNVVVSVYRLSENANLNSLYLTNAANAAVSMNEAFTSAGLNYTASIPYAMKTITVNGTLAESDKATVTGLGSWSFASGSGNDPVTAKSYTKNVVVSAENCKAAYASVPGNNCVTKTYKITLNRAAASTDGTLSKLAATYIKTKPSTSETKTLIDTDAGTSPSGTTFDLGDLPYQATKIDVSTTASSQVAVNANDFNGAHAKSIKIGTASAQTVFTGYGATPTPTKTGSCTLAVGDNTCNIVVTAEDGSTTKTYTIKAHRRNNVRTLQALTVTTSPTASLSPSFTKNNESYVTYEYKYDAKLSTTTPSILISATATDTKGATVQLRDFNGNVVSTNNASGVVSASLTPNGDQNNFQIATIAVTSENGDVLEYQVKFKRATSTDGTLKQLTVNGDNIALSANKYSYNYEVDADTTQLTSIVAVPNSPYANQTPTITYKKGTPDLAFGDNGIEILVTSESGQTTQYNLTVTRKKYNIPGANEIRVGYGSSTPQAITLKDGQSTVYDLSTSTNPVANATTQVRIEIDKAEEHAVISGDCTDSVCIKTLTKGANSFKFRVTSQDGSAYKEYTLNIYRELDTDNTISNLRVKLIEASLMANQPNDGKIYYEVTVPSNVDTISKNDVTYSKSATATEDKMDSLSLTNKGAGNPNVYTFAVIAQNGARQEYVVNIIRPKYTSTEATFKLKLTRNATTYASVANCDASHKCTLSIPAGTTSYYIDGFATVTGTPMTFNPQNGTEYTRSADASDNVKTHTIRVTAEDTDHYVDYNLEVTRNKSTESTLSELKYQYTGDAGYVDSAFTLSSSQSYTLEVPSLTSTIRLYPKAKDVNATILELTDGKDYIDLSLGYGQNSTTISVKPEDGSSPRVYTINVNRAFGAEARLSGITINGADINTLMSGVSFDKDTFEYTIAEQDYNTKELLIGATNVDTEYGTYKVNGSTTRTVAIQTKTFGGGTDANNRITVTGVAHDGKTTQNYYINVKRKPSNSTTMKETDAVQVYYDGAWHTATWNASTVMYEITVPNSFKQANGGINISATPKDPIDSKSSRASIAWTDGNKAIVTDDPVTGNVNDYHFDVVAEDGVTKKSYTLEITREKSSENKLASLEIQDPATHAVIGSFLPGFSGANSGPYTVSIPVTADAIDVVATVPADSNLRVNGVGEVSMDGSTKTVTVSTIPEDGVSAGKTYTLNIVRAKSNDATLSNLVVTSDSDVAYTMTPSFNPNDNSTVYAVTIPGTVDKVKINPTGSLSLPSGVTQTITQTAYDDAAAQTYTIPTNSNRTFTVTVVAEDGTTTKNYQVKVTRAPRTDMAIDSFTYTIDNGTTQTLNILDGVFDYTIAGPMTGGAFDNDGISNIAFSVSLKDSQASVTGALGTQTVAVGKNEYKITTTAEDTSVKQEYTIHVTRWPSHNANLQSLSVSGNEGFSPAWPPTNGETDFTVTMPNSVVNFPEDGVLTTRAASNKATIVTDPKLTGLSTSADNFYNIVVKAEDCKSEYSTIPGVTCTSKTYSLNIVRKKSSNNFPGDIIMTDASLSPTFTKNGTKYTITLPYGGTHFGIDVLPDVSTTSVTGIGSNIAYADLQAHPTEADAKYMEVKLVAEDGTAKILEFKVKVAQSNDKSLSQLYVDGYSISPDFSASQLNYGLSGVTNSETSLTVHAQANNQDATIRYIYNGVEKCGNVSSCTIPLNTAVTAQKVYVEVTPQDASPVQTYKIEFNIEADTDSALSSLTTTQGVLNPSFNSGRTDYNVYGIENTVDSTKLNFTTSDPDATVIVKNNGTMVGSVMVGGGSYTVNFGSSKNALSIPIEIVVTAEDSSETSYKVTVNRSAAIASSDASLSSLSVAGQNLKQKNDETQGFASDVLEYTIGEIDFQTTSLTLTMEPNNEEAKVYVNGTEVNFNGGIGTFTVANLPLENGSKGITVRVIAGDTVTVKDYRISYSKTGNNDATLSNLSFNMGTLTPSFSPSEGSYTLDYPDGEVPQMTATASDSRATLSFDGRPIDSGVAYGVTGLTGSSVQKVLTVLSEDGTVNTYTITFKKKSGDDLITSNAYGHEIDSSYILSVADRDLNHPENGTGTMTLGLLKTQLDNDPATLKGYTKDGQLMSDDDIVTTGTEIRLIREGEIKDSKRVVIRGDVDGDGMVTMNDFTLVEQHFLEFDDYGNDTTIHEEIYQRAADVDTDDMITMNDYTLIEQHFLEYDDFGNTTYIDYASWLNPVGAS